MGGAKDIWLAPISAKDGHAFIRQHHYSGKSVQNSQLHLGIFLAGRMLGALQFGPSLDKRKLIGLVAGTRWNEFIELNRLALIDDTPKNTESRALAMAMRIIRKQYPHIQWVVSFADATQCGDGTIYRASGFVLTGLKKNTQIWEAPNGRICEDTSIRPGIGSSKSFNEVQAGARESRTSLTDGRSKTQQREAIRLSRVSSVKAGNIRDTGASSMKQFKDAGFKPLEGFQLRYIYFLDPTARERLTVPEIPFSQITAKGATMYLGKRPKDSSEPPATHAGEGGAAPTRTLQNLFPLRDRMARLVTE